MSYAQGTSVPVEKSKAEIERMVTQRGATKFMSGFDEDRASIAFFLENRMLRFIIEVPDRNDPSFHETPARGRKRSSDAAFKTWEAECRRVWRALAAVIKAKFIAIDDGVYTFDEAFLSDIVMPDGKRVLEHTIPAIGQAYESGKTPPLLATDRGDPEGGKYFAFT